MVIIESKKEFDSFLYKYNDTNWLPIIHCTFTDDELHTQENEISFLTIRFDEDYILPFNHSEAINLDKSLLEELKSDRSKFVYNKKEVLQFIDFGGMIDINFLYYLKNNQPLNIEDESKWMWKNHFRNVKNPNIFIPILKQYETIKKTLDIEFEEKYYIEGYDNFCSTFSSIESNGIYKDDALVYTQYNPYTTTGRPSNRFGGLNFAALNKSDGSRKAFKSRFDYIGRLVEFDYDAYHLRLIGEVIGYELPKTSVHQYFADIFDVSYDEAKIMNFKLLYGDIPQDIANNVEFFGKVKEFINKLWTKYNNDKYIETYIYRKKIYANNFEEMSKTKLFNYFIQNLETERNMKVLDNLLPKIEKYESKLVLYNYDAFLFDLNPKDGLDLLKLIKKEMEEGNYLTKVSSGINYDEMEDITEKL